MSCGESVAYRPRLRARFDFRGQDVLLFLKKKQRFAPEKRLDALWPMTGPAMNIHIIRTKEPMPQAYHQAMNSATRAMRRRLVCPDAFTQ